MQKATLIGFSAILLWGALALFTAATAGIPPFQLLAMTFAVAFLLGLAQWARAGQNPFHRLALPVPVWLLGVGGLFGYHFFYFMALKNAPVIDASLIAYLWPLLIVVFSALLPGERLRWHHIAGAVMGLSGSVVLIIRDGGLAFDSQYSIGYLAAAICALTWSGYSVLSRRFGHIPTDAVGGFCAATAILATICHFIFEVTVVPSGAGQWLAIIALGLGPVGLAFFTWDYGVKKGNIRVLGAASYCAPLLSTLLLVAFGETELTWRISIACLLIVAGAVLAAKDMLRRQT
mgnify:FL=1|tara:strand:- start:63907 stop:64776 length:870 start_codon:yes stop_codon:yes gene_type:complete